jgi:hypothetical protein
VIEGGVGADSLDGGTGLHDVLSYEHSSSAVNVDLGAGTASGGDATGDTIANFEDLTGSGFDDTLAGSTGDNIIHGLAGNDTILGGDGNDQLFGDDGNDTLHGGEGNDVLAGNGGLNQLFGDNGDDRLVYGNDGGTYDGGNGIDTLALTGNVDDSHGPIVQHIERLDMTNGSTADTLTLNLNDILGLSNTSDSTVTTAGGHDVKLFISGDSGDHVSIGVGTNPGQWHQMTGVDATVTPGGAYGSGTYDVYQDDQGHQVAIQTGVVVS